MYPQYIDGGIQKKSFVPKRKDDVKKYAENLMCVCGRVADFDGEVCRVCVKTAVTRKGRGKRGNVA